MKHVIIGCGIAGVTAAETLRRYDPSAEIVMVADEPYYYRAALSFFLKGKIDEEEVYGKPDGWYKEYNIQIKNNTVSSVDAQNRMVLLNNDERFNYDRLLIASGASPFVLPWQGVKLDGVCTYRTLECVKRFLRHVHEGAKKAVIIGGGILGVELVDDFVSLGLEVTLLVRGRQLLELLLDDASSKIIENQMRRDGVHIRFETEAERFEGKNGKLSGVVLKSGEFIETSLVGIAIGIRPNIGFLEGKGIKIDRAVLVNKKMETSVEGIFAAGDVCAMYNPATNRSRPTRTWLLSALQGKTAALNMLNGDRIYDEGAFFNASHAYGSMYAVLGRFNPDPQDGCEFVICTHNDTNYEKLVLKDNRIVGAVFVGSMKHVWPVKQMIEAEIDISEIRKKLCSGIDFQMFLYNKHTILF